MASSFSRSMPNVFYMFITSSTDYNESIPSSENFEVLVIKCVLHLEFCFKI